MTATNMALDVPSAHPASTRTPQNTPSNAAPISSRAQQPGVDSIMEGELLQAPFLPCTPRDTIHGLDR